MEARTSKEETELLEEEKRKKSAMTKEVTKSMMMMELKDLPNEILVKIFNFLPNHDIRCGVSLACKKFKEICQDESLVPVKDLCIFGQPEDGKSKKEGEQYYSLRNIGAVFDIITQSKNLTYLKIKAMDPESVNELVSTALQACPKLTHLEIIESPKQIGECFECKITFLVLGDIF